MYDFAANWSARIEAVSSRPEFQNSVIRIEDPSLLTKEEYDLETGEWTVVGDPVIYQGQARLIAINANRFDRNENQSNPTTITSVRIQIPNAVDNEGYGDEPFEEGEYAGGLTGRVKRGCKVFVESAPRNPSLTSMIFTITSDLQGSSAASRTFEASFDGDINTEAVA